ncbi:MAG: hypothetical protein HQ478_11225 [Chloroflexi bacterium]|nr:hypothetical protein [Chloroflexota bacterium]
MPDNWLKVRRSAIVVAFIAIVTLFIALPAFSPSPSYADTTLATDGFESGTDGGTGLWDASWAISGDASIEDRGGPHSGSKHLRLRRDTGRAERELDLSGQSNVHLQFWAKAEHFGSDETASVEVSPDGVTWTVLKTWVDGDDDKIYYFHDLSIPDALLSADFFVAFDAEMGGTRDKFYVDDIALESVDAPNPTPTATPVPTATPSPTPTPTAGPTPTPEPNPTATPEPTATATPVPTPAPTATVGTPVATAPVANITLDGQFTDWAGVPNLVDPPDDSDGKEGDIYQLFWSNNTDGDYVYFMISRYDEEGQIFDGDDGQDEKVTYSIFVDTNNNGDFDGSGDREVRLKYDPRSTNSKVTVDVRPASGDSWSNIFTDQDYGNSDGEGGINVEIGVPWSELGLVFGQPIRMFAESDEDDRIPDSGDVQWSPASILGPTVLISLFIGAAILLWWFRGRHMWKRG